MYLAATYKEKKGIFLFLDNFQICFEISAKIFIWIWAQIHVYHLEGSCDSPVYPNPRRHDSLVKDTPGIRFEDCLQNLQPLPLPLKVKSLKEHFHCQLNPQLLILQRVNFEVEDHHERKKKKSRNQSTSIESRKRSLIQKAWSVPLSIKNWDCSWQLS